MTIAEQFLSVMVEIIGSIASWFHQLLIATGSYTIWVSVLFIFAVVRLLVAPLLGRAIHAGQDSAYNTLRSKPKKDD